MTSRYRLLVTVVAVLLSSLALAGCPRSGNNLGWTFPVNDAGHGGSITQLPDGDYFASGNQYTGRGELLTALRVSSTGSLRWLKTIDNLYTDGQWSFGTPVTDSDSVVIGQDAPYYNWTGHFRVVRLAGNGDVIWDRTYGQNTPPDSQQARAVMATGDGGCLTVCQRTILHVHAKSDKTDSYTYTYLVVLRRLNEAGDIMWEQEFESPAGFMGVTRMIPMGDGGAALIGSEGQILRVGPGGDVLWWNQYATTTTPYGAGVASDGGFVLAGTSMSSFPTPVVYKTDADGNLLWSATDIIPNQGNGQYTVRDAALNADGRIVLVGQVQHVAYVANFFPAISNQGFIMQLDSSAHFTWLRTLDVYDIKGVTVTSTGDYATVGSDGNRLQIIRVTTAGKVL